MQNQKPEEFKCRCGHVEKINSYVIAQTAMGHSVVFTCECNRKITISKKRGMGYTLKFSKPNDL